MLWIKGLHVAVHDAGKLSPASYAGGRSPVPTIVAPPSGRTPPGQAHASQAIVARSGCKARIYRSTESVLPRGSVGGLPVVHFPSSTGRLLRLDDSEVSVRRDGASGARLRRPSTGTVPPVSVTRLNLSQTRLSRVAGGISTWGLTRSMGQFGHIIFSSQHRHVGTVPGCNSHEHRAGCKGTRITA